MPNQHPNLSVLKRFDPSDISASADVFSEGMVWHFFNSALPDLQGDYIGLGGFQTFFEKMAERTNGTFKVNPQSATAIGDELVVSHVKNTMTFPDRQIEVDAVVVWRILDSLIVEAWDIPSVNTAKTIET